MVKIIYLSSRKDFQHFFTLFTNFRILFSRLRSIFRRFSKFVHSFLKNLANQSSWNFCQMLELPSCMANKLFRSIRWILKKFFYHRKKVFNFVQKSMVFWPTLKNHETWQIRDFFTDPKNFFVSKQSGHFFSCWPDLIGKTFWFEKTMIAEK